MSLRTRLAKALTQMVFGRVSSWFGSLLPRSNYDYSRDIGDGTRSSVVMAPVLWIARQWPEAPLVVEREGEVEADHAMAKLLHSPNPYYSGLLLEMARIIDFVVKGNSYVLKIRNRMRGVVQLWYVPWWMMKPIAPDDGSVFISHYEYSPLGVPLRVEPEDVIHHRFGIDPQNSRLGLSALGCLLREVFTDEEAAAFTASLLRNAGVPGLVVSPGTDMAVVSDLDKKDAKEFFKGAFAGDRRGEPLVMTAPTRVEQFGFNPQQLDLAKLREIPEERVCAVLGIPAAVVGFGSGLAQTKVGATMAEMREMAYESAIVPLQRLSASEYDRQLLPDFEPDPETCRTTYDLTKVRVLQEDQNRKATRCDTMVRGGWMLVSAAKREMGHEVLPGDDVYLRSFSTVVVPGKASIAEQVTGTYAGIEPPPPPAAVAAPEAASDEEEPSSNGKSHALTLVPLKSAASDRRRFYLRQMREQKRLSSAFAGELVPIFRELGERAADAWSRYASHAGIETLGVAEPETKRLTDEELRRLVQVVVVDLQTSALPYEPHYLRVALSTVDGLRGVFGLGVNLSEPMEMRILAEGGRRLGLVDMASQTREAMFRALSEARESGAGPREIARLIREQIPAGPWSSAGVRAEVIARTETAHAQNFAALEAYRNSDTVTAIEIVDGVYGEPRSDAECIERNGDVVSLEEAQRLMDDEHPNGTLSLTPVVGRGE